MAVGRFFFSAAPTAQNSPELHFRFINYFIQSCLLRSLQRTKIILNKIFSTLFEEIDINSTNFEEKNTF